MYWFLRTLAVAPLPAFIGGAGFMLSTTLVAWLPWTYATTMVFLPILFGLVERLAQAPSRRVVALLALALAGDGLAGYPPSAFHGMLATAVWVVVRAPWRAQPRRYFVAAAAAAALAAGLVAVQAFPAVDYVRESAVYFYRNQWTPPLTTGAGSMITALMPYFFGVGVHTWTGWHFGIAATYFGVVSLFGLPLAFLTWRRAPTLPLVAMAAIVAAVHYGAPGIDALADAPGMALVNKLRLMPLLVFPLCALGALGLDIVSRRPVSARSSLVVRTWFVIMVATALVAVGVVIGDPATAVLRPTLTVQFLAFLAAATVTSLLLIRWLVDGRARWGLALAVVQLLTLAPVAATYLPVRDARWLYPTPPAIAWLQQHAGGARVLIGDHVGFLYGLRQASGYDGLTPRRIEQVAGPLGTGNARLSGFRENVAALHGSEPLAPVSVLFSPVRDLAGLRFIVLAPGTAAPLPGLRVAYDGHDARVFENPAAFPRAFVARRARCVDDRAALALMRSRAVDLATEVLLADCVAPVAADAPARNTDARIEIDESERVIVRTSADATAWLVLNDTWFPGWTARVDGTEVPILRANHAFRAVALTAGSHRVEFTFRPRGFDSGAGITLATAGLVLLLFLPRPRTAVTAAVVALLITPWSADAALSAPPFELTVSPRITSGGDATVTVRPRARTGRPWDLYVVWLYTERAAFLAPDGQWHPQPIPFRARAQAGQAATVTWKSAGPAGDATLALLTVEPGGDPLERLDWRFRPSLATVHIASASGPRTVPYGTLAPLALAAVVAVAGVLRWPRWPTPPTVADRTRSTSRRPLPADSRP
jgi:hypothetical protein